MRRRIDDIEILRAFAVLLVIVEHTKINLLTWISPVTGFYSHFGGWTGVDLFFAISGFVIAKDLVPKLQATVSTKSHFYSTFTFWIRRFWRLVPSAWLWVSVIIFASIFFNTTGAWGTLENNIDTAVSAIFQFANLHVAQVYGKEFPGATFIYWSLSLEEQFYFVLPIIVLLSGRWLVPVLVMVVVSQLFVVRDTAILALFRTDALFLGVLIALFSHTNSYKLFRPDFLESRLAGVIFLSVLIAALALIGADDLTIIQNRYGLIAVVSAVLVMVASYDGNYFCNVPGLKTILLWIGTRSYALYLIHIPSYFATREIWHRIEPVHTKFNSEFTYTYLFTATIILVVFTELNYKLVETPFRKIGARIAQQRASNENSPSNDVQNN